MIDDLLIVNIPSYDSLNSLNSEYLFAFVFVLFPLQKNVALLRFILSDSDDLVLIVNNFLEASFQIDYLFRFLDLPVLILVEVSFDFLTLLIFSLGHKSLQESHAHLLNLRGWRSKKALNFFSHIVRNNHILVFLLLIAEGFNLGLQDVILPLPERIFRV